MKRFLKKYAPQLGATAIAITAVASAAVTPLPGSLPASVATGGTVLAADINAIIDSLNILDARTDGDAPVDDVDIVNKGYLDTQVAAVGDWQKGKICPDGEIFQGYNADESPKCETPDAMNIASKDDIAAISGGGGSEDFDFSGVEAGTYLAIGGSPYFCKSTVITNSGHVSYYDINHNLQCDDAGNLCYNGECAPDPRITVFTAEPRMNSNSNGFRPGAYPADNIMPNQNSAEQWCLDNAPSGYSVVVSASYGSENTPYLVYGRERIGAVEVNGLWKPLDGTSGTTVIMSDLECTYEP